MPSLIEAIVNDGNPNKNSQFPYAPDDWNVATATELARREGMTLTDEHWEVLRALQSYFARHQEDEHINTLALHDALEERFHRHGGLRHLYHLFPGGPVVQGCRLAGLHAPAGAFDPSYGSVM